MSKGILDFKNFMHIGIVVRNIEETLEKMGRIFDIKGYRINQFPPEEIDPAHLQLMYHGKKSYFSARFCFIQLGGTEMELIEPGEGESIWWDFLKEKGEGIHHLKFEVDSINETMGFFLEQGIPCPQYGSAVGVNLGKTWAYFDTVPQLGYLVEVLNRQVGEQIRDEVGTQTIGNQ